MPRFLLGDEHGHIKSLRYLPDAVAGDQDKAILKTIYTLSRSGGPVELQALAASSSSDIKLTAAFSDGSISTFHLYDDDTIKELSSWKEPRLKENQRFIGLAVTKGTAFSCTSNGALRVVDITREGSEASPVSSKNATLPIRLRDWKLSDDATKFIYGGDEVDVSLWDTELAFQAVEPKKREGGLLGKKRTRNDLFPGELWRAKNVANDALGLRQPIRINSLTFLDPTSSATHVLAGTELGDARRYDTRAGRRPVAEITSIGRVGGVRVVSKGANDNEVFISDNGSNLFSVDLRNGKVLYGYKGLSGSVNSIAATPRILATTALDRFARIHSVAPPPENAGQRQDHRGEVVEKVFTKSNPTCILWDGDSAICEKRNVDDDDGIWENMEHVGDESDGEKSVRKKHRQK
ncbi:hypothetical protein M378DRAFT_184111 [Amanita muscaria Koide BX008]|uniref:Ribosome biogenesis protein NSA1 n=1 Tax=Amanita muscaria (strain Koide BX008) TaxID=946122 RepID=A0A0C2XJN5_AMAMK|nr:hypothetical protein M378DRAFT_184111 [Amanita muscaria Koide BX008]